MEERIRNYEAQIANLKKWRNVLYVLLGIFLAINIYLVVRTCKEEPPTDGEVLYAASEINYMGVDPICLDGERRQTYIDIAREAPEVQEQIKKNREKK